MNAFKVSTVMLATLLVFAVHAEVGLPQETMMLAAIDLDQAARRIRRSHHARILSARTRIINGREVHVFKVLTRDGRIQHIKVDAGSGRVFGRKRR
ncbi:MAG: hypothetical protein ABFS02_04165 [Pseudomonadota bacterium]